MQGDNSSGPPKQKRFIIFEENRGDKMQEKIHTKFLIFQVVSMRQRGVKINMDGGFWKRKTKQTKTGKIHQNLARVCT